MGAAMCRKLVSKEGLDHDGHEKLDEDNEAYFARVEKRNKVRFTDETPTQHQRQGSDTDDTNTNKPSGNTMRNRAAMLKHAEDDALMRQTTGLSVLPSLSNKSYNVSSTGSVLTTPSNASISSALSAKSTVSAAGSKRSTAYSPLLPLPAPAHDSKSINSSNYSISSAKSLDASISSYRTNNIPRKIIVDSDSEFMQQYVHFDDDNKTVLTTETGGNITLTSLSAQQKKTAWSEGLIYANITRQSKVTALAWDNRPGSTILAIGCEDGSVVLVNVEEYHQGTAVETIDSPVSKSSMRSLSTRSSRNGESCSAVRRLPPREGKVRSMSFSPRDHHLAIGGEDCTMIVLNLSDADTLPNTYDDDIFSMNSNINEIVSVDIIGEIEREDRIHAVEYSPSGQYIAVAGFDGICAIVDASTLELVTEIARPGLILCVAWHPLGHMIAVGGSDKEAAVIDSDSWEVLGEIQRHGTIQCLRWSPHRYNTNIQRNTAVRETAASLGNQNEKEGMLAVGGSDGKVAIIDMDTKSIAKEISLLQLQNQREELRRIRRRKRKEQTPQASTSQDSKSCRVNSVSWSPDGLYISICGSNGMVIIVETSSFAIVQEVNRSSNLTCIAWQPLRGKYLAVGGDDHNIAVLKTGGIMGENELSPTRNQNDKQLSSSHQSDAIRSPSGWVLDETFNDAEELEQNTLF